VQEMLEIEEPRPEYPRLFSSLPPKAESNDLRHFIRVLADAGQLVRIREMVDWRFEIGRIARARRIPLLFENIKDYPGARVFTNGLCSPKTIALALGLNPLREQKNVIEAGHRVASPIMPKLVETGLVLENIVEGGQLDLLKLPVPQWSDRDAGRYLGTWHINVTKDPETGSRNVGVYRMQLLGSKQATVSASPRSHLARHFAKAERKGEGLPMAVAIGVSETVLIAAAAAYPDGLDEFELASGLQREAVELLRCKTADLEVPAHSEIVIEGFIQPGVRVQDGPYFDYTGNTNTNPRAFLFHATRLTFRSDPIFRGTSIGVPGAEDHQLFAFLARLNLVDFHGSRLKQAVQNMLLRQRRFRTFQVSGKTGAAFARLKTLLHPSAKNPNCGS
jgi:4-hydroxy-3-polyprenylbenzoate decarboxylase